MSRRYSGSDRSNLGELFDCKLVALATGGVPRGKRLLGDLVGAVAEISGVVREQQVEVLDIHVGLVSVNDPDPIRTHADVARGRVTVDHAGLMSGKASPRCTASGYALRRHRGEVDLRPGLCVKQIDRRSPARALWPAPRQLMKPA